MSVRCAIPFRETLAVRLDKLFGADKVDGALGHFLVKCGVPDEEETVSERKPGTENRDDPTGKQDCVFRQELREVAYQDEPRQISLAVYRCSDSGQDEILLGRAVFDPRGRCAKNFKQYKIL